jgi:ribosomal protein S18 acetylase RimI-like enzyme
MTELEIRNLQWGDVHAAGAVLAAAFEALNPAGMIERLIALAPETSWFALADGRPAGLVSAVQYDRLAYVGPMGVHPALQGQGIGRALLARLVESLEERECETMLLDATDAGEPLYRKFGFVDDGYTCDMRRDPGPGLSRLADIADLDAVLASDLDAFGADRSHMIRWLLYEERAGLFTVPSQGHLIAQNKVLGPITAKSVTVARHLAEAAIAAGATASRVLAPRENLHAAALFEKLGFRTDREVLHMRRGPRPALRREQFYSLASFALG